MQVLTTAPSLPHRYVRKLQFLFRSPRYQRQVYLRRRACLTMQAAVRQRTARKMAEERKAARRAYKEQTIGKAKNVFSNEALAAFTIARAYRAYRAVSAAKEALLARVLGGTTGLIASLIMIASLNMIASLIMITSLIMSACIIRWDNRPVARAARGGAAADGLGGSA